MTENEWAQQGPTNEWAQQGPTNEWAQQGPTNESPIDPYKGSRGNTIIIPIDSCRGPESVWGVSGTIPDQFWTKIA